MLLNRARRASKRSPRYLMGRVMDAGRIRLRRPWSRVYPRLLTDRALLKAAGMLSLHAL